jgi:hypothetical protein
MCIIAIKKSGIELPKKSYLENCFENNKDGAGFAFTAQGMGIVHIMKGYKTFPLFYEALQKNVTLYDTCIMHFRFATHGKTDAGNTHPFPVTQNKESLRKTDILCTHAMAHNGVMSQYHHVKFSDTQKFILDVLSRPAVLNNLHDATIQKLVSAYIDGDKLAILTDENTVTTFGEFVTDEGILYSNGGFKMRHTYIYDTSDCWHVNDKRASVGFSSQSVTKPKRIDASKALIVGNSIYHDICDGCLTHKTLKLVEIESSNSTVSDYVYLCKRCRKVMRKGKLNLSHNDMLLK